MLVIRTKLAAAIFGGVLFGGRVLAAQYCPYPLPLWLLHIAVHNVCVLNVSK